MSVIVCTSGYIHDPIAISEATIPSILFVDFALLGLISPLLD
jgi:hypothetical protein